MNRRHFGLVLYLLFPFVLPARAQFGRIAGTVPIAPTRMLTDPARPRIYASVPSDNTVKVIDTNTLSVAASIRVGSLPGGLSISADGTRLYVACAGSTVSAVSVIDLNALQALPALNLDFSAANVAAGLDGRLYVSSAGNIGGVYQVDTTTGSVQGPLPGAYGGDLLLQISPDRQTLYISDGNDLDHYDVSTDTAALVQRNTGTGDSLDDDLVLTPDGRHICLPHNIGNDVSAGGTAFYETANLNLSDGSFQPGNYGGQITFGPDSAVAYQVQSGAEVLKQFDTGSFALLGSVPLPYLAGVGNSFLVAAVAVDNTGSYVFVSEESLVNETAVFYTGRGPAQPTSGPPTVSVAAAEPSISPGQMAKFKLRRTGDTSQPLTVYYKLSGSAYPAEDYGGAVTFAAGNATAKAKINSPPVSKGNFTIKLTLRPEADYAVGTPAKAKIKITN